MAASRCTFVDRLVQFAQFVVDGQHVGRRLGVLAVESDDGKLEGFRHRFVVAKDHLFRFAREVRRLVVG